MDSYDQVHKWLLDTRQFAGKILKLIVRNLEMLVDSLKTEIYSDVKSYKFDDIDPIELDYDKEYEGP